MFQTLDEYIDAGIQKAGNAFRLAGQIGRSAGYINQLKRGFAGASDETLIRLARFIGADEGELLLLYHSERATGASKDTWENVKKKYFTAAMPIIFCTGCLLKIIANELNILQV